VTGGYRVVSFRWTEVLLWVMVTGGYRVVTVRWTEVLLLWVNRSPSSLWFVWRRCLFLTHSLYRRW